MTPDEWQAWASWAAIVITLGIATVGWNQNRRAARDARKQANAADLRASTAETHAARALELAESAEARADRLEQLAKERRDVRWVHREVDDRETLSFQNVGSDTAHDVELIVDPVDDHPRQQITLPAVGPADRIGIKLTALAREAQARFDSAGPGILLTPGFTVRARITWRSESRVPGIQEWDEIDL